MSAPAAPRPITAVQFVNTLAVADGGPARNSFEVNLALNALPDVTVRMFWFTGSRNHSVLAGESRPAPHVGPLSGNRRAAVSALRSADVAIIHGFYLWWVPLVAVMCRLRGVPYVIMPHGVFTRFQRRHSPGRKRVFDRAGGRGILRRAAAVLVASDTERDELLEFAPSTRVAISGVGTPAIAAPATGAAHSPAHLVTMSRIAPKKRIDVAILAAAELLRRGESVTLTVAGTGDPSLVAELRQLALDQGVDHAVSFVGAVSGEAKRQTLVESDLFLAPSEDENFGISVAEALAHGLLVVATKQVSAAAVVENGPGALIDAPSPTDLADSIRSVLDRGDFGTMRERAVELATEHYGWPVVAERWAAHLRTAAAAGRRNRRR